MMLGPQGPATVRDDMSFELEGLFGPQLLSVVGTPVRAGEYILAAVAGLSMTRLLDPSARAEVAERIAKAGERIILAENEKHSIDLRIANLQ